MSSKVRTHCHCCNRDVDLPISNLVVQTEKDSKALSYRFTCPFCTLSISRATSRRIADLLISEGVRFEWWRIPSEVKEREELVFDSFSENEIEDFVRILDFTDNIVSLFRSPR